VRIELTTDLLADLGYEALTADQATKLLQALYETMEGLVGQAIFRDMSNEQMEAFEQVMKSDDEAGALAWLERNVPEYKELVRSVFVDLQEELRGIVAAFRQEYRSSSAPSGVASVDADALDPQKSDHSSQD
jgi:Protein of unknown function (DUF5663)